MPRPFGVAVRVAVLVAFWVTVRTATPSGAGNPCTAPVSEVPFSGRQGRRIFQHYAEGKLGTTAIARALDAEGAPAPRKQGWSPNALQLILGNPAYRGLVRWNGESHPGSTSRSLTRRRSRRHRRSCSAAAKKPR
jgi:Recombinase